MILAIFLCFTVFGVAVSPAMAQGWIFLVAQSVMHENVEPFPVSMMAVIRLDSLMFMLVIGVYLTRKGIAELFKKE